MLETDMNDAKTKEHISMCLLITVSVVSPLLIYFVQKATNTIQVRIVLMLFKDSSYLFSILINRNLEMLLVNEHIK